LIALKAGAEFLSKASLRLPALLVPVAALPRGFQGQHLTPEKPAAGIDRY